MEGAARPIGPQSEWATLRGGGCDHEHRRRAGACKAAAGRRGVNIGRPGAGVDRRCVSVGGSGLRRVAPVAEGQQDLPGRWAAVDDAVPRRRADPADRHRRRVAGWEPHGKTTIERLHQLAARTWRPMDCDLIDGYSGTIEAWVVAGAELLAPAPRVYLPRPCPRCSQNFAYHRSIGGELVRTRALRVSDEGASCGSCGAHWGPDRFHWLAKLLGFAELPS